MISHGATEVRLPSAVADLLDGQELERKVGTTILLMAAGHDDWPRLALLSVGEVLSMSGVDLRLALYSGSRTTAALTESGRALLNVVLDGTSYKIEAELERRADNDGNLAYVYGHVTAIEEDWVGYAKITSGVTYELVDRRPVLQRWSKQVERLKRLTP